MVPNFFLFQRLISKLKNGYIYLARKYVVQPLFFALYNNNKMKPKTFFGVINNYTAKNSKNNFFNNSSINQNMALYIDLELMLSNLCSFVLHNSLFSIFTQLFFFIFREILTALPFILTSFIFYFSRKLFISLETRYFYFFVLNDFDNFYEPFFEAFLYYTL